MDIGRIFTKNNKIIRRFILHLCTADVTDGSTTDKTH